jgi:hypothetical protein
MYSRSLAPHRDVGATRMRPSLVPRHRFRGAAVGAAKALLPRDLCRTVFLLIREPCPVSHSVSLACPDMQTLPEQRAYGTVMEP